METTFLIIFTLISLFFQTYGTSSSNTMITASSNVTCIQRERQSLLVFKQGLEDESNRLSTWTGVECCEWQGVGCDRRNGHVVKLDLRSPLSFMDDYTLNTSKLEGKVSPSLLNLKHLHYLDLSMNNFRGQNIPEFFGSFKHLEYLNLSYSGFSGVVPPHLGNLSRLQYLDLNLLDRDSMMPLPYDVSLMVKDDLRWVSLLSSLKHLDFSGITIGNHIDWFHPVNKLPSLLTLNLASCDINIYSKKFINFTSLNSLDLSSNGINSTIPVWLSNLTALTHLNLYNNSFHGGIPDSIGSLSSLSSIDLSWNQLSGPIPPSLGGLSSLTVLRLYRNQLSGSIPESIGLLTRLQELSLHINQLSGNIPTSLGQLSNLQTLALAKNQLSGVVSEIHFTKLNNLTSLYLSGNPLTLNVSPHWIPPFQLEGFDASSCNIGPQFPNWLQTSTDLEYLNLRNSSIRDTIPEWFQNISSHLWFLDLSDNQIGPQFPNWLQTSTHLEFLYLSNSSIRDTIPEWFQNISSHLWFLDLSDNQIGPQFPNWLQTSTHLEYLYLSNSSIRDTIPEWFQNISSHLWFLDLSDNQIGPQFPNWLQTSTHLEYFYLSNSSIRDTIPEWFQNISSQLIYLDLSDNDISGNLPRITNNAGVEVVVLRKNRFTGSIPSHFCELHSIRILDLSHNNIFGSLPDCLGNLINLRVMDLTSNNITGDIPNSLGSLSLLESLHMHKNKFEGNLPESLQKMEILVTMDLGNNLLMGNIPFWIGKKLSKLKILNLQSNMFMGMIPPELCQIKTLQHLNLANNRITGSVPHCFGDLTGMIKSDVEFQDESLEYEENIEACIKGIQLKYTKTVRFLISLDLSSNKIIGEIPDVLMNLEALTNLNLSRNRLSGHIPTMIGYLTSMESLDLSTNKLSGRIPASLASLDFLGYLNLSFNKLSGPIPVGNHLQTFDPATYKGNNELCGFPLRSCKGTNISYTHVDDNEGENGSQGFSWFYAGMVPGFVVGFMGLIVSLHYIRIWRVIYFEMIENVYIFLTVSVIVTFARLRRKFF